MILLLIYVLASSVQAQLLSGKGGTLPLAVLVTPHFRVLHPPRLEGFARRVGAAAELIHESVVGAVGNDPGLTYILVNDETDEFNGFALPGPYPFIRVYATFPRPNDIGAQWQDALVALIGHEFTHVAHLTTRDDLRRTARAVFGSIPSVLDARLPPAWFVEGYAVYMESKITIGGRVYDSGVRTLRRSIARSGRFPSLSDAGIGTYEEYPYGNTRYAFGAGFVPFLIARFGEDGVRRAIARYNETLTFNDAWRDVHRVSLETLWAEWRESEIRAAAAELEVARESSLPSGEFLHDGSGVPVWQSAARYAFLQGNSVRFGRLEGKREIVEPRFTTLPSRPNRLSFTPDGALVYSRLRASGATTYGEVYRLRDGVETRLTTDARARDAVADGACVVYVRDVGDESSLRRICEAREDSELYAAPQGWHLAQPAINAAGEIALTVWRPGGVLDVAVLRGTPRGDQQLSTPRPEFLTSDAAQDQFPTWFQDGRVAFSSDRSGIAQVYVSTPNLKVKSVQPITANVGGAYASSVSPLGRLSFSGYTAKGFETRSLESWTPGAEQPLEVSAPQALQNLEGLEFPVEAYAPNLLPVFWTPVTANGIGATVYGADAAGIHSYQLSLGYDFFTGTGINASLSYSFAPRLDWSFNFGAAFNSSGGFGVQLSAPFTGRGESLQTGRFSYTVTPYLSLEESNFTAGFNLKLAALQTDVFGYTVRGWNLNLGLASSGKLSLGVTLADFAAGGLPVAIGLKTSFYGNSTPIFSARLETQVSFGLDWRFPDGFVGLERVTVQPFALLETSDKPVNYGFGAAFLLDFTVNYYAPISLGLEARWERGNGFTLRLVSLVPLLEGLR